jgi:hypothetical protein
MIDLAGSTGILDDSGKDLLLYMTFQKLVVGCEKRLSAGKETGRIFSKESRVDHKAFKAYFGPGVRWNRLMSGRRSGRS